MNIRPALRCAAKTRFQVAIALALWLIGAGFPSAARATLFKPDCEAEFYLAFSGASMRDEYPHMKEAQVLGSLSEFNQAIAPVGEHAFSAEDRVRLVRAIRYVFQHPAAKPEEVARSYREQCQKAP